jgi:molybdate transport system substrate-binding protein
MLRSRARKALIWGVAGALWTVGTAVTVPAAGVLGDDGGASGPGHTPTTLLVFAAASVTDALGEVDRAFTARTHVAVRESFAASSVLAKQIEAGAPAQVFFSADLAWMDYLQKRDLLRRGSRRDVLGNALVLIAPADSAVHLTIAPHFDLTGTLGGGRLATGDPDSVPAGKYARAALEQLGVWDSVAPRLVRAENVRMALEYVARGEAALGIVYRTDARAEKRVRVVDTFPAGTYPPIIYPVAVTAGAQGEEASRFVEFLCGPEAQAIFARYGFTPPPAPASPEKTGAASARRP